MAELGNHRRCGAAAVDDDARMFTDTFNGSPRNCLLIEGDGLALIGDQFLRHGHRTTVAAQEQAVGFQRREILANGHF
ncbi:hypothetical protein D3C79_834370 [compost metagenome]